MTSKLIAAALFTLAAPLCHAAETKWILAEESQIRSDFQQKAVSFLLSPESIAAVKGGFWADLDAVKPRVWRFRDRVFVGDAAAATANRTGVNGTWVPNGAAGASWAPRDSQFVSMADRGTLAVTGMSRTSDSDDLTTSTTIGVAGFVVNNGTSRHSAWGLYSDLQHEASAGGNTYGLEVAAKNKGADHTAGPYGLSQGVYGIWLAGGGDPAYGGSAANPSNAAIVVLRNGATWNKGLVFSSDSLTGTNGRDGGSATAIDLAQGHEIVWSSPTGGTGSFIQSNVSSNHKLIGIRFENSEANFLGNGARKALVVRNNPDLNPVNNIVISNNKSGAAPSIECDGADRVVDCSLKPKGNGALDIDGSLKIGGRTVIDESRKASLGAIDAGGPIQLATYKFSELPKSERPGRMVFCSDCKKPDEKSRAGTGVALIDDGRGNWTNFQGYLATP